MCKAFPVVKKIIWISGKQHVTSSFHRDFCNTSNTFQQLLIASKTYAYFSSEVMVERNMHNLKIGCFPSSTYHFSQKHSSSFTPLALTQKFLKSFPYISRIGHIGTSHFLPKLWHACMLLYGRPRTPSWSSIFRRYGIKINWIGAYFWNSAQEQVGMTIWNTISIQLQLSTRQSVLKYPSTAFFHPNYWNQKSMISSKLHLSSQGDQTWNWEFNSSYNRKETALLSNRWNTSSCEQAQKPLAVSNPWK